MQIVQPQAEPSWQGREVVREIDRRPHLLVRIEIRGGYFPHRAAEPFVRIVDRRKKVHSSWFADVAEDSRSLLGYFPTDLPSQGTLEFGYGAEVTGRVSAQFRSDAVDRLQRERLPQDVVPVSTKLLNGRR